MLISWHGLACFRIAAREANLVIDPFAPNVGPKLSRMNADLVLLTSDRPEHNHLDAVSGEPFVIRGPGEYEVKNVFVWGQAVRSDGPNPRTTTLYVLETEEVSLAHLGDLGVVLGDEQLDRLEGVDVLIIPVGGHGVLDAKKAGALISEIEPRIVIPMYYRAPGFKPVLDSVDLFVKELGIKSATPVEKYKIVKKDLPQEETSFVILTP